MANDGRDRIASRSAAARLVGRGRERHHEVDDGMRESMAALRPIVIERDDVSIEVLAQGSGPVVVLLPSLGRGAADFDPIAQRLADAGYRVLRPQPRGIGGSRGPLDGIDLHDCAADVAAVIEHENRGAAFVVGHAFGNRVARMLATDSPSLVRAVALVDANIGKGPSPPQARGHSQQRQSLAAGRGANRRLAICLLRSRQ
jgi:pimeloyl-ACP methyl ester carboxylesterase